MSEQAKENARQRAREWHANNRERANAGRIQRYRSSRENAIAPANVRRFSLTPERYAEMFAAQGGRCFICRGMEPQFRNEKRKFLAVDHDHACCPADRSCGECVRALVCSSCNYILGRVNDDPDWLNKAEAYLRKHQALADAG